MKSMKRYLMALMCALMLAVLPVQALAAQGDVIITSDDSEIVEEGFSSICTIGDTLYAMDSSSKCLYAHRVGEAQPQRFDLEAEEEAYRSYNSCWLFGDNGALRMLQVTESYSDNADNSVSTTVTAKVFALELKDGKAEKTLLFEPDMAPMMSGGYFNYVERQYTLPGYLVMQSYDEMGNNTLYLLKLADGTIHALAVDNMIYSAAYAGGKIIVEQFDYNMPKELAFSVVDPETGAVEELSRVEIEEYAYYRGIVCDTAAGTVYTSKGGEVCVLDVATGKLGDAVAAIPMTDYETGLCMLDGGYIACASYNAYAIRSISGDIQAQRKLKIVDTSYSSALNQAFYAFINAHGDVTAVLSRDYDTDSLIDSMMARDGSVDVFILSSSDGAFAAVRDRGYMASLEDSEAIHAASERMNENMKAQMSVDGELCCLPVDFTIWGMRVNEKALEGLGLTLEDIPTNWSDLLDFLPTLVDLIDEHPGYSLLDPYTSDRSARQSFFDEIFDCYQVMLNKDVNAVSTAEMTQILEKLERIDFSALGQPTEEETMSDSYYANITYEEDKYLLEMNVGSSLQSILGSTRPIPMSLTADTQPICQVWSELIFINPFSENADLALQFVEEVYGRLDESITYVLFDDLTEPVKNPSYEDGKASVQAYIDKLKKQLETVQEVDRQALEEELAWEEEYLANYEKTNYYMITAEDVAWVRSNGNALVLQMQNWLYSKDGGDAYDYVRQYIDGKIDAAKLMNEIDRKLRMMIMEGN